MAFNFQDFQLKAQKALDHVTQELGLLRTGKASVQLLDPVKVEAYGTFMKISEVANVTAPDPNLLMITPWDKSLITAIEKAIFTSGLNLSPVVDGSLIRIVIPPLTEERRKEMVKLLHQKVEAGRVMLRSIRTDVKKEITQQKGQPGVSEDDIAHDESQLEEQTKAFLDKLDQVAVLKEKELMTI